MSKISDTCFLVMSVYGIERMTKRQGTLKRGEVAVRVAMTIPERCFEQPDVAVTINVPESAIIQPTVDVAVLDAEPQP